MDERSQSHATWDCKYHVFFASKYRTKCLHAGVRREVATFWILSLEKLPD